VDAHAIEVNMPTARMESHGILMAYVWFEREGWKDSEAGQKTTRCAENALSEQSNIIMAVYEWSLGNDRVVP